MMLYFVLMISKYKDKKKNPIEQKNLAVGATDV